MAVRAPILYGSNNQVLMPGSGSGLRDETAALLQLEMRQYLLDTINDRFDHAQAVAQGEHTFRVVFIRCMGFMFGNNRTNADHVADVLFAGLKRAWVDRYQDRHSPDYDGLGPEKFLDAVHIETPKSAAEIEREIDDAWVLDIEGSDEALRMHYEGEARHRTGSYLGARAKALLGRR